MISKETYKYCCENISKIENFEKAINDSENVWHCHHRLETHTKEGVKRERPISIVSLKNDNLYYHRPASELIFLTKSEHTKLHNDVGKVTNSESMKKILRRTS